MYQKTSNSGILFPILLAESFTGNAISVGHAAGLMLTTPKNLFLITYRVPWKGTVPQRVRIPPGKLSLQPVAIGADDGGNDIVRSTSV